MPTYDFRCEPCEDVFEISRPASDRSDVPCPACGASAKRVFSPVGVVFKGTGFHNTDYRTEKAPAKAPSPKDSAQCAGDAPSCASCPAKESSSETSADG